MEKEILDKIRLVKGDITRLEVDAIVNAANNSLLGGGGVDGAIHRAAGPGLLDECRTIGGCPTGEARITKGYDLPAAHVIHTVGPVYNAGDRQRCRNQLASCYRESLALAEATNITSVAFPAISCGVYGYPLEEAVRVAVDTTIEFLRGGSRIRKVIFVQFSDKNHGVYRDYLETTDHLF